MHRLGLYCGWRNPSKPLTQYAHQMASFIRSRVCGSDKYRFYERIPAVDYFRSICPNDHVSLLQRSRYIMNLLCLFISPIVLDITFSLLVIRHWSNNLVYAASCHYARIMSPYTCRPRVCQVVGLQPDIAYRSFHHPCLSMTIHPRIRSYPPTMTCLPSQLFVDT